MQTFDPLLILRQIAVLQCCFYAGLVFLQLVLVGPFANRLSPEFLFSQHRVATQTLTELLVCVAFALNAALAAAAIRVVVARAKKCWDFGATLYILHLAATTAWSGFPVRWLWWAVMLGCATVTILLAEFLCARFELAEIPIAGIKVPAANGRSSKRQQSNDADLEAQLPLRSSVTGAASSSASAR